MNTGIDPHGVFTARFTLPEASYSEPARVVGALTRIEAETAALHGVTAAAVSSYAAMGPGGGQNGLLPEGVPFALDEPDPEPAARHHARLLRRSCAFRS